MLDPGRPGPARRSVGLRGAAFAPVIVEPGYADCTIDQVVVQERADASADCGFPVRLESVDDTERVAFLAVDKVEVAVKPGTPAVPLPIVAAIGASDETVRVERQ